ncbi:MAG: hypothetical protein H7328_07145 [Bdellovibrio sp.]|nr:hypothetical protein [Bdellovibrio sp.]
MSKARTQPSAKTGLVFKISIALFLLLAVVLYKMNDYFKQEKWFLAQNQLRTQIVSTRTAVSSQLNQLKNILSSYETDLAESKINWVQLDPFFGIAKAQKSGNSLKITQYIGRSGSVGDRWNNAYLEKALTLRKSNDDSPIMVQLFRDKQGGRFLAVSFQGSNNKNNSLVVVGSADYFQKYFDLNRGGKMTSLLKTTDNVLAAHNEADYVATLTDEASLSPKKYLIEKEEIAGTNLVAMNYISKAGLVGGFVVPWSVVGLISGFGFILIGLLFYGLDPIERKVERYRKQEREQIFKETLEQNLKETSVVAKAPETAKPMIKEITPALVVEAKIELAQPMDFSTSSSSLMLPLQQALFNTERALKSAGVTIEKQINTNIAYDLPFAALIKAFEIIFNNSAASERDQSYKKIVVRAYDIEQNISVIEIKDVGINLPSIQALHADLTEALSLIRQAGADLTFEKAEPSGVLMKMIMKKALVLQPQIADSTKNTYKEFDKIEVTQKIDLSEIEMEDSIDLDQALSLDDIEVEPAAEIKTAMTSKNFKTSTEPTPMKLPEFILDKKDFRVDEMSVSIRRPNAERTSKS